MAHWIWVIGNSKSVNDKHKNGFVHDTTTCVTEHTFFENAASKAVQVN